MKKLVFLLLLAACAQPEPQRVEEINPRENEEQAMIPPMPQQDEFGEKPTPTPAPKKVIKKKHGKKRSR